MAILGFLLVGIILASTVVSAFLMTRVDESRGELQTFTSRGELEDFIARSIEEAESSGIFPGLARDVMTITSSSLQATDESSGYSTTNIQVAGVDEADIVKTDGQYIYLASNDRFIIVDAIPANEMKVVAEVSVNGSIIGLFTSEDRLIIIKSGVTYYDEPQPVSSGIRRIVPGFSGYHIQVYDILSRDNPFLVKDVQVKGTYVNSRMIGDWVYAVASQPVITWAEEKREVVLPEVSVDGKVSIVPATSIHYVINSDVPEVYTLVVALDAQSENQDPDFEVMLTGYGSTIYVSEKNIYLTMPLFDRVRGGESTTIHRIAIEEGEVTIEANGEVPGRVLNQFSMDEHDNNFRVATTVRSMTQSQPISQNNLYILDSNLQTIGSLEGLAPGEQIYSARFMGDRCYLVTFKKVDPLFTIDVSNPTDPKVLGKLKIPGYSDYLHQYDENHLIGIGKETVEAKEGDFAWYQGVKFSLFDVSDVENPKELSKLIIGDRGTDSPVLRDHHALLIDKQRNLLITPILEAKIISEKYPQGVPDSTTGEYVYQGAYVLNLSIQDGFSVKGKVTHIEDPETFLKSGHYMYSEFSVSRSIYIGEVLYTISEGMIKANNLQTLNEISVVTLG